MKIGGKIVVIGDVMLDVYISGQAHRLSPEAPVPVIAVESKNSTLGGAGNVALNLAGLGCEVCLFGVRGNDPAGNEVVYILAKNRIDNRLIIDHDITTTTKTRVMANSQQLVRFDEEKLCDGSKLLISINGVLDVDIQAVILSDYAKGILLPELIGAVIEQCNKKDIPVFIDPKRGDWSRYHGATVITPNLAELEAAIGYEIQGDTAVVAAAKKLLQAHAFKAVLVTMGSQGMLLVTPEGHEFISSMAREVFDVSGAGDTVIATLAACICSGYSLSEAAQIANMSAGIVVGKLGTQPINHTDLQWEN